MKAVLAPTRGESEIDRPNTLSFRLRRAQKFLIPLLEKLHAERGAVRILDVGGAANYWQYNLGLDMLKRLDCTVEIVNVNSRYFGTSDISPRLSYAVGDGCALGYQDWAFDLAHSNSVIEHVGDWKAMRAFASEARRVARSYFVQVPNFWFPYEPHFRAPFFHWLPEQVRARMLVRFAMGVYEKHETFDSAMQTVQGVQLLDRRQIRELFPDARIVSEQALGLAKSLMAIRDGV